MHLSIGQAAEVIGVCVTTLRRWESDNYFCCDFRTKGGHRRYSLARIQTEILEVSEFTEKKKTIGYARVSSADQKLDLKRQENRVSKYCQSQNFDYEIISDLGSGLNFKKKGLVKLIDLICKQQINRLVLTHKDRLLRFGTPLLFKLCDYFKVTVEILEAQKPKSFEQELTGDVIELMTVFTARMYGKRSHRNKKLCANQ